MSALVLWMSQRARITVILSLCFLWTAYYLWATGNHDSLITTTSSSVSPGAKPKTTNFANPDDGNHFASHTVPLVPTTAATKAQATQPVESANGAAFATVAMQEFDPLPIRELCAQTSWVLSKDVVINCDGRVGGVGNIRQEFLVCVRHAIEIGAALIRPRIMLRNEDLIEYQSGPIQNMSYMFDLETFDTRLRSACPLLALYDNIREVEKQGRPIARISRPWALPEEDGEPISPKTWAVRNLQGDGKITVIDYPLIMGQTPVCRDPTPFVLQFGGLIEFRPDVQLLAAHAMAKISSRFNTPPAASVGVTENAYIGVHLRTEVDAVHVGYTSFDEQVAACIGYINSTLLRVVYAASGNTTSLELFGKQASTLSPPAQVVTKWDLLDTQDVARLKNLTWDQAALVDYLILEKSSKFAGVSESSFSWGLAYARQRFSDKVPCTGNSSDELYDEDGVVYQDNLSSIYGVPKDWHVDKLWP